MKKNCNRCKALERNVSGLGQHCALNHPIEATKELYEFVIEYKPLEECEKPLTNKELVKLQLGE